MMNNLNSPVKRQSLANEVATRLQQQISLGQYQAGQQLPTEPELMQQFGVGRSTIREAVRILCNAGLIRVQQGVGSFVEEIQGIAEPLGQRLQRAMFSDLNEVRLMLEQKIAEKAAQWRSEQDLNKISRFLQLRKEYGDAGDKTACIDADINFHTAIAEAGKNDVLADLYKTVAKHLKNSFLDLYPDTTTFTMSQHLHESLYQSIADQEPKQALYWAGKIAGGK
ncbi:GntR family transcriptional regulator [Chitinophaga pendula]|uniref:FadR/GntR family transcriptional regulator n=1 Tax=Chitinophaga TaxID=79328 RepID=UPI000BB07C6F|nr:MULTISPECIES: GntR family transcriptional regulator [Chitinophaga]ASZ10722.1 GntR family transcriptional regulator [Chitinophaga sp. MD30]UCJ06303.1 GntR family transcriptional regulator [Chitinophaga pendula]